MVLLYNIVSKNLHYALNRERDWCKSSPFFDLIRLNKLNYSKLFLLQKSKDCVNILRMPTFDLGEEK